MNQKDFNLKFAEFVRAVRPCDHFEWKNHLKDSPRLSAVKALEVYQEDYQARLTEALRNTYPAIHSLIGEEDFLRLASDYINIFPSCSPDLDDYGNHLCPHLTSHPLGEDYIFLSELAHFEWNFREVFHLEQIVGMDSKSITELLTGLDTSVQLVSSVRVLDYNYSLTFLYALKDSETSEGHDFDFKMRQYLLMIKSDSMVKTHILSKNQWEIMKKLGTPNSLLDILQNAPTSATPEEIKSLFQILGTDGLLKRII